MNSLEKLKSQYRSSWLSWFINPFITEELREALYSVTRVDPFKSPLMPGGIENWKYTVGFCKTLANASWPLRWLFQSFPSLSPLGGLYTHPYYESYTLLSSHLKEADSSDLYLYLVYKAEDPQKMVALLKVFQEAFVGWEHATSLLEDLIEFTQDKKNTGSIMGFLSELIEVAEPIKAAADLNLDFFIPRFVQFHHLMTVDSPLQQEWFAHTKLVHIAGLGVKRPSNPWLFELFDCTAWTKRDFAHEKKEEALDSAKEYSDLLHALYKVITTDHYQGEFKNQAMLAPMMEALLDHPHPEEATRAFIHNNRLLIWCIQTLDAENVGLLRTASVRDYMKGLAKIPDSSSAWSRLEKLLPSLVVLYRLGLLDGPHRLSPTGLKQFNELALDHPIQQVLDTLYRYWNLEKPVEEAAPLLEPRALCAFFSLVAQNSGTNPEEEKVDEEDSSKEALKNLQRYGWDTSVLTQIPLPETTLSSEESSACLLRMFQFLYKMLQTSEMVCWLFKHDLVLSLLRVVHFQENPEQALITWALEHQELFSLGLAQARVEKVHPRMFCTSTSSPLRTDSWSDWVQRMSILLKENKDFLSKLPVPLMHIRNRLSLTPMIEVLKKTDLLEVLLLPNAIILLEELTRCWHPEMEMGAVFARLKEEAILTSQNFSVIAPLLALNSFLQQGSIKLLHEMKQKGMWSTESIQEYLCYQPFLDAREAEARAKKFKRFDLLEDFYPSLKQLHEQGLLSGKNRLSAPELFELNQGESLLRGQSLLGRIMTRLIVDGSKAPRGTENLALILAILKNHRRIIFRIPDANRSPDSEETIHVEWDMLEDYLQCFLEVLQDHHPTFPAHVLLTFLMNGEMSDFQESLNASLHKVLYSHRFPTIPLGLDVRFCTLEGQELAPKNAQKLQGVCEKSYDEALIYLQLMRETQNHTHSPLLPLAQSLHGLVFSYLTAWRLNFGCPIELAKEAVQSRASRDGIFAQRVRSIGLLEETQETPTPDPLTPLNA